MIKAIYEKAMTNIILNDERQNAFPLRSETRQRCPLLPLLSNEAGKRKRHPNWKGGRKIISACICHNLTRRMP